MTRKYAVNYHVTVERGLINDPNGLIQFRGQYHVFFQWNQHGTTHANKSWGHVVSDDMMSWQVLPVALEPTDWFDKDGVYSGSAVAYQDTLCVFYTGNVKDEQGNRSSYQCLATSTDGITFKKHGVLFEVPMGYTAHVRDPKVWFNPSTQQWQMILGAQKEDLTGDVLLYTSSNLYDWTFEGSFLQFSQPLGYMWECPDVIQLPMGDVFIFSPQGLEAEGLRYHNIFQTCYVVGQLTNRQFLPKTPIDEVDRGFEFYAPQTFRADDGRVILYAWMGAMPAQMEEVMPTVQDGWVHQLSIPRVLSLKQDKLYQYPVDEVCAKRVKAKDVSRQNVWELECYASDVTFENIENQSFRLCVRQEVVVAYQAEQSLFTVERTNWASEQREVRQCVLEQGISSMRWLLEESSLEVFINEGEEVFSLRYFADDTKEVSGHIEAQVMCYALNV